MKPSVALVDDHILIRDGLVLLLQKLEYPVIFEANNGIDFFEKMKKAPIPDIVLMDINMPVMDGYETTLQLRKHYPTIKVLALSMYDHEKAILRMIRAGAKGFILKNSRLNELNDALHGLMSKGFYQSDIVTGKLIHSVNQLDDIENVDFKEALKLTAKHIEFLKLVCTDMTYKEIAEVMRMSVRTIDGYREELFAKLNVRSRIGLAIFAIKEGIMVI